MLDISTFVLQPMEFILNNNILLNPQKIQLYFEVLGIGLSVAFWWEGIPEPWGSLSIRKREKSSSVKKFELPKKLNFFPPIFFVGSYGSRGATKMADHSF